MDKHDQWKTQFADPKIHEECGCEKCHEYHLDEQQVEGNSLRGYQCCIDQIAQWVAEGERCPIHPHAYFESAKLRNDYGLGLKSMCEDCNDGDTIADEMQNQRQKWGEPS